MFSSGRLVADIMLVEIFSIPKKYSLVITKNLP